MGPVFEILLKKKVITLFICRHTRVEPHGKSQATPIQVGANLSLSQIKQLAKLNHYRLRQIFTALYTRTNPFKGKAEHERLLGEEHINFLMSQQTLSEGRALSLLERCQAFELRYPGKN